MNQLSTIPAVRRSVEGRDAARAVAETRWPAYKTMLFVCWTSAALWAAIIIGARAALLAGT